MSLESKDSNPTLQTTSDPGPAPNPSAEIDSPVHIAAMAIYSVLFAAGSKGIDKDTLCVRLRIPRPVFNEALEYLYHILAPYSPFFISEADNSLLIATRPEFGSYIREVLQLRNMSLSDEAMALAFIIANKQPVTRTEIDEFRGVDSEKVLKTLEREGMIEHVGELSGAGITAYYKVTPNYLRRLGVKSISELPSLDDLRAKTSMA